MKGNRRHTRSEILEIANLMAEEFEERAQASGAAADEVHVYLRTAKYMRELLSIAQGRRSAAYWVRRRTPQLLRAA